MLFNDNPSTVKSYSSLNYEGSQARIKKNTTDEEYYNLNEKKGWYVETVTTNLQDTDYLEFKNKEGKWFSSIKGITTSLDNLDTSEFSVQGIGSYDTMTVDGRPTYEARCLTISPVLDCGRIYGCMDPESINYDPNATFDDGSCIKSGEACGITVVSEYLTGVSTNTGGASGSGGNNSIRTTGGNTPTTGGNTPTTGGNTPTYA